MKKILHAICIFTALSMAFQVIGCREMQRTSRKRQMFGCSDLERNNYSAIIVTMQKVSDPRPDLRFGNMLTMPWKVIVTALYWIYIKKVDLIISKSPH